MVDCDVLQADGSTRTASICGGWVALTLALARMWEQGLLKQWPLHRQVVAVAVGMVGGEARVDLDYGEDLDCDVDLNLVFTADGRLVEVQGTAEGEPFGRADLDVLLDLALPALRRVLAAQRRTLLDAGIEPPFPEIP
jgi:ribonuclease PH